MFNLLQIEGVTPSEQQQILATISKYLGVQYSTAGVLISCLIIVVSTLIAHLITHDTVVSILIALIIASMCSLIGLLPLWVMFAICLLLAVYIIRGH